MKRRPRTFTAALLGTVLLAGSAAAAAPVAAAPAAGPDRTVQATATAPLTNLSHLDFLRQQVQPPAQPGHTTYQLSVSPQVGMLWTYAEPGPDGAFRRVGGGRYDQATDTWGQGAYNADDISRAAVVYLRHWRQTGTASSRDAAYELLRGLTYLQTASGANAGNVVLWVQPDGTLHPSAEPHEEPDPSDSGPSYWLARTVWALGEGYAAWRDVDPAFAGFLRERLDLAVAALDRQVLIRYGSWQSIDGERTPAWLIVDGADATAEAVLGLAAYCGAGCTPAAHRALDRFAEGIAALSAGDARHWPFGAVRPWALSRSVWHAWGSQMPAGLARAGQVLGDPKLVRAASTDSATFTPWLLTSGGPDNGRLPTATDRTQIAYGVDSRVQSLLATSDATGEAGFRRVAGVTAAWFFGANAAGVPVYDPATGRTADGVSPTGQVSRNSGAESTIHGLLSMLALDAYPDVAATARQGGIVERIGTTTVEAESGTASGGAAVVTPPSAWTGESLYSGAYVSLPTGGGLTWQLPAATQPRLVLPVVNLQPDSRAMTTWYTDTQRLGQVDHGRIGEQGTSPAPGALLPVTLSRELPAGADTLRVLSSDPAMLDAVMLEPLVSRLVIGGAGHGTALVRSAATAPLTAAVSVPGQGPAVVEVYDARGALQERGSAGGPACQAGSTCQVLVLPGGFTIVRS